LRGYETNSECKEGSLTVPENEPQGGSEFVGIDHIIEEDGKKRSKRGGKAKNSHQRDVGRL